MTSESTAGRGVPGRAIRPEDGLRRLLEFSRDTGVDPEAPTDAFPRAEDEPAAPRAQTGGTGPGEVDSQPTVPLAVPGRAAASRTATPEVTADTSGAGRSSAGGRWDAAHARTPMPPGKSPLSTPLAKRIGIAFGAVVALTGLAYLTDLLLSSGQVPRGTVVAGIDIGGMNPEAADARLRAEIDPRATTPLPVTIGQEQTTIVPSAAGLHADWAATWSRIGGQPLDPITRLTSLWHTHEVVVASTVDEAALDREFTTLRRYDRPTVEGTIVFENARPVGVPPVPGRILDVAAARTILLDNWALGRPLDLPETTAPMTVRPEAVDHALRTVAEPAVSAPITLMGKGVSATLDPEQLASVLSFEPDEHGGLAPVIDHEIAIGLLAPQLAESEVEPKDAAFTVTGSTIAVVPAVIGETIDWPKTLDQLSALIIATGERAGEVAYEKREPELTTEAAQALNITEVMGKFTTSGFSGPSGVNIRTVADKVNGAVVAPGDIFSLNDFTGPRGVAEGYVESGIIDHGRPSTAVGGGISQFATTLFNAAYFAGLEDAGHTEHSYYISRYPAAREATVFDGVIDLRFRNNTANGVYIEAFANSSTVTVRMWGVKTVDVESVTGERTRPTEPATVTLPEGEDCIATEGAPGFTVSDTRIVTDHYTGREITRTRHTVTYDPIPVVECE
ncbi:VanW family protein [Nocardia sp. CNY236]|uniref:VanW family protein n=1 Tax=Nocardia sp. CNY236 TaxID=1169152 RepID=UPI00048C101E|nr:VanW family protein [Nocardia sp. CNY236]